MFRDDRGKAYVLDAYCPHLGANIAIGGHVIGDCLECPFHGWQFRGADGKVTKIPYSESSMSLFLGERIFVLEIQHCQNCFGSLLKKSKFFPFGVDSFSERTLSSEKQYNITNVF